MQTLSYELSPGCKNTHIPLLFIIAASCLTLLVHGAKTEASDEKQATTATANTTTVPCNNSRGESPKMNLATKASDWLYNYTTINSTDTESEETRIAKMEVTKLQLIVGSIVLLSVVFVGSLVLLVTHILGKREVNKRPWLYKDKIPIEPKMATWSVQRSQNEEKV